MSIKTFIKIISVCLMLILIVYQCSNGPVKIRCTQNFNKGWKFYLGDVENANNPDFDDSGWRDLKLPHDWSIEGEFSSDHPATPGGGALPGGIGWYRKSFSLPAADSARLVFIEFDGIYENSEVWINGNYLGKRPYGYSSFRYELTPYLNDGQKANIIAVKVDNSHQPNSRWYSGSGIYRNVWLVKTSQIFVEHWGTFVTTPEVSEKSAIVNIKTTIGNRTGDPKSLSLKTIILNEKGKQVAEKTDDIAVADPVMEIEQQIVLKNPQLWSDTNPNLYTAVTRIFSGKKLCDDYKTPFGIRYFEFHPEKGFLLNGNPVKIRGVCDHHDLGCLGSAINTRAIERQLEILKAMGCNGIRTSHNPPAPELLDLCDRMGFIIMDEAFDVWAKPKTPYGYNLYWDEWHQRDMSDFIRRDRNHPSVFMWSIGNEVMEQWDKNDSSGTVIAKELTAIVKSLDATRPVTANCNETDPLNPVLKSGALDLIGYSYHEEEYVRVPEIYPGKPFIASETESSLATRGMYDMPSDSIRRWPIRWDLPFHEGNPDFTCSAYDNCSAPWGSTHEETWKIAKKYDFISGVYIWTGFDYLGEPTPYSWPSRSSYFGIIDLAGFPKDAFYFYRSEWNDNPVLHVFPHWNWEAGQAIDVWVYTNYDEVELFLNGESFGKKLKGANDFKLVWNLTFLPGEIKAIAKKAGLDDLVKIIKTADAPAKIVLETDRNEINADGTDLSFVTVKVVDSNGILVPRADNLINFEIHGVGKIVGVDNGLQTSHEPFQANYRKAYNGLCLAVVQASETSGRITLKASSDGLAGSEIVINTK